MSAVSMTFRDPSPAKLAITFTLQEAGSTTLRTQPNADLWAHQGSGPDKAHGASAGQPQPLQAALPDSPSTIGAPQNGDDYESL